MKTQITNIQLTEIEIDIVIEALENLPSKNLASNMMQDILSMALGENNDREKVKSDMVRRTQDMEVESNKIKKNTEIIKAKIILAKSMTDN